MMWIMELSVSGYKQGCRGQISFVQGCSGCSLEDRCVGVTTPVYKAAARLENAWREPGESQSGQSEGTALNKINREMTGMDIIQVSKKKEQNIV